MIDSVTTIADVYWRNIKQENESKTLKNSDKKFVEKKALVFFYESFY